MGSVVLTKSGGDSVVPYHWKTGLTQTGDQQTTGLWIISYYRLYQGLTNAHLWGGVALTLVLIESRSPWSCHEPEFKKALLPLFHILHPPGIIMNFGIIIIFMAEYGEYGHKIMHQKRCVDVYRWACAIFSIILQGTWDSAKVVQTGEFEDMECDLVRPFHFLVLT